MYLPNTPKPQSYFPVYLLAPSLGNFPKFVPNPSKLNSFHCRFLFSNYISAKFQNFIQHQMTLTHFLNSTFLVASTSSSFNSSLPFPLKTHTIPPKIYNLQYPLPIFSRRLLLPAVSGIWDALTGGNNPREAIMSVRRGMLLFREGDVLGSLEEFNKAIELDPCQKACAWQRGISLYYLDRFEEGAEQFRLDVTKNPDDTEESIWCFLCEARLCGVDEARRRFLEVGRDPRPYMQKSYKMFKDGGDPEKLVAQFSNGQAREYFYASLYAGLYYESQNEEDAAKPHIVAAYKSPYGQGSDDYMAAVAKVHCLCRNWNID